MFIFKWLLKLSLYYWVLFIALVVFDVCPGNTIIGKLIKQYQIKLSKNMHINNNVSNTNTSNSRGVTETDTQEGLKALVNIIQQLNQQQNIPAEPNKNKTKNNQDASNAALDKLINDAMTK